MIIVPASHLDHNLTALQLAWILQTFGHKTEFFIETAELPEELGTVPCALYGPIMGDEPVSDLEVAMVTRNGRPNPSRTCQRPARPSRLITVIGGPHELEPCVLWTAFGGPRAPRELGDPTLSDKERAASEVFWAEHALGVL